MRVDSGDLWRAPDIAERIVDSADIRPTELVLGKFNPPPTASAGTVPLIARPEKSAFRSQRRGHK